MASIAGAGRPTGSRPTARGWRFQTHGLARASDRPLSSTRRVGSPGQFATRRGRRRPAGRRRPDSRAASASAPRLSRRVSFSPCPGSSRQRGGRICAPSCGSRSRRRSGRRRRRTSARVRFQVRQPPGRGQGLSRPRINRRSALCNPGHPQGDWQHAGPATKAANVPRKVATVKWPWPNQSNGVMTSTSRSASSSCGTTAARTGTSGWPAPGTPRTPRRHTAPAA